MECEPMVTEQSQVEEQNSNSNIHPLSDHMNISVAFREIVSKDPPRYTQFVEAVNKTMEEISDCVGPEEFKNIMGDTSFLKSNKTVTNILSALKMQMYKSMTKAFEENIKEENLTELFKKEALTEQESKKYVIEDDTLEILELEETLRKLDVQIASLEETNDVLFNQEKFNKQRFDQLSELITMLLNECQTKYIESEQQTDRLRKDYINELNNL